MQAHLSIFSEYAWQTYFLNPLQRSWSVQGFKLIRSKVVDSTMGGPLLRIGIAVKELAESP